MNHKSEPTKGNPTVALIGPLPPPIGGVSSHILRLSAFLSTNGFSCTVVDAYPSDGKVVIAGVKHVVVPVGGALAAIFKILFASGLRRGSIVHAHYSRIVGRFLIFAFFIPMHRYRTILTLHDGDQAAHYRNSAWPYRILARLALRRINTLVSLSDEQHGFYLSLGVPSNRIVRWGVALPLVVSPNTKLLPTNVRDLVPIEDGGDESILMTSGYPDSSYGYENCLELLDRLSPQFPCKLVVCLYGVGADSLYEKKLRALLSRNPNVVLIGPLPAEGFLALLTKASVYFRPTTVDSWGLAVTDALNVGVSCLASDICARDPRCETFPVGDKEAFMKKAHEMLILGRSLHKKKKVSYDIGASKFDVILDTYRSSGK